MSHQEEGEIQSILEPKKNSAPIQPSSYRTKVCEHFKRGYCYKGNKCSFLHQQELQKSTRQYHQNIEQQCKYYFVTKNCKELNCRFSHKPWENENAKRKWAADNDQFILICYKRRGTTNLGLEYDQLYEQKVYQKQNLQSQPYVSANIFQQIVPQNLIETSNIPDQIQLDPISDEENIQQYNDQLVQDTEKIISPYVLIQNRSIFLSQHQPFSITTQNDQLISPNSCINYFINEPTNTYSQEEQQQILQENQQQQSQSQVVIPQYQLYQPFRIQNELTYINAELNILLQQQQQMNQQQNYQILQQQNQQQQDSLQTQLQQNIQQQQDQQQQLIQFKQQIQQQQLQEAQDEQYQQQQQQQKKTQEEQQQQQQQQQQQETQEEQQQQQQQQQIQEAQQQQLLLPDQELNPVKNKENSEQPQTISVNQQEQILEKQMPQESQLQKKRKCIKVIKKLKNQKKINLNAPEISNDVINKHVEIKN